MGKNSGNPDPVCEKILAHMTHTMRYLILGQKFLSYPCYLTQAVSSGLLIGCIGTHAHGRPVTSMFDQSDTACDIASQRIQGFLETYFKIIGEQEKYIFYVKVGYKTPSLEITVCHHSASLVMPNSDLRGGTSIPPSQSWWIQVIKH